MSVVTDLQEARELILKREHWTTEALARNATGVHISTTHPEACQWCAMGALDKVCYSGGNRQQNVDRWASAWAFLRGSTGSVTEVNDFGGHEEVIKMYDKAIADAKSRA